MYSIQSPQLISDDLLADLASPGFEAQRGEFDVETRAMLATALPEICRELLIFRQMARHKQAERLEAQKQVVQRRLADARRTIRSPEPAHARDLTAACKTLLRHSTDVAERTAASDVLAQMQEAA